MPDARPPAARPESVPSLPRQAARQGAEVLVILLLTAAVHAAWTAGLIGPQGVCLVVVTIALAKTAYFLVENLQHILLATSHEMPYHRFLGLMGVNMAQITLSFAVDFWLLESAEAGSFTGFDPAAMTPAGVFFDCLFYSVLNFSFFGFGEILPRTIPAKIVTLLEVVLAFFTGRIDTVPWITHRVPFAETVAAFPRLLEPTSGVIKAVIHLPG